MLFFFHGSGERGPADGSELWKVKTHGPWRTPGIKRFAVIAPQCPTDLTWPGITDRVLTTVRAAFKRYALNPSVCCATGLSMGAFGSWAVACREPEMFQTIVPICGGFALPMASNTSLRQLLPLARHDWTAHDIAPIKKTRMCFFSWRQGQHCVCQRLHTLVQAPCSSPERTTDDKADYFFEKGAMLARLQNEGAP